MLPVQRDTSGPLCVGCRHLHTIYRLTNWLWHRLDPCRHSFCITCIIKAFSEQGRQALWYTCPRCAHTVGTTPPMADRGVGPIAHWLQGVSGADVPSLEEVMRLDRELGDVCSWDSNNYLLNSGLVGTPPPPQAAQRYSQPQCGS